MTDIISDVYLTRVVRYSRRLSPSARGKPAVRGKPPDNKIRGKPKEGEVQKYCVLAIKKMNNLFGFWNLKRENLAQIEAITRLFKTQNIACTQPITNKKYKLCTNIL